MSFNVIGDQWTPYTYTKKRKKSWSQSRTFLFDLRSSNCPLGWESRAEEAKLRAVSYFSVESRRSRARHSACEGRETMAEARVKKKISSLQPHLSSILLLICTLSLFRSSRLTGKKDDRSRSKRRRTKLPQSLPHGQSVPFPGYKSIKKVVSRT